MHAFNEQGFITRYTTAEEICAEHFKARLAAYARRKEALLQKHAFDEAVATNKSSFVRRIIQGELNLLRNSTASIIADLVKQGFQPMSELRTLHLKGHGKNDNLVPVGGSVDGDTSKASDAGFSYLLTMPIQSLTLERAAALETQAKEAAQRLSALRAQSPSDMWLQDLDALEAKL